MFLKYSNFKKIKPNEVNTSDRGMVLETMQTMEIEFDRGSDVISLLFVIIS